MKNYKDVEVTEKQLEELIRQGTDHIEEGLRYVDHQRMTDRGPLDVLLVDSGNALAIAELKVVEDDGMLVQGIDYYDWLSRNTEGLVRAYKAFKIDPTQPIRLLLIAPNFSQSLLNRCKWVNIRISLYTYNCVRFEDSTDVIPFFHEVSIPSANPPIESYRLEDRYNYITDEKSRTRLIGLVDEIQAWNPQSISVEPIKYAISLKVSNRVFAYVIPQRKRFLIQTFDDNGIWTDYPVDDDKELEPVRALVKINVQRKGPAASA